MTEIGFDPSSTHPPLPPTPEDDRFHRLRLLRSRRVGIATYRRLLAEYGTAQNALCALPEIAHASGVKNYAPCPVAAVQAELKAGTAAGAFLLSDTDPTYPALLAQIEDAPPFLWIRGRIDLLALPACALVGARNASSLGTRIAKSVAQGIGAAGCVIVSGLARGIDAAAHQAGLDTGTIAVLAGGIDQIYPHENAQLGCEISRHGLLLSEQAMGLKPIARHFPARNRIISGLAQATVVIEAAAKSGSLITARNALDQGRDVLAVPGHPLDPRSAGCNMLIRDGATLVRGANDVLEVIQPLTPATPAPEVGAQDVPLEPLSPPDLGRAAALHAQILDQLSSAPISVDQLARDLHAPMATIASALVELELDREIERNFGGLVSRLDLDENRGAK